MIDVARLGFEIPTGPIDQAASALDRLQGASVKTEAATESLAKSAKDSAQFFKQTETTVANLRAELNPLYASSKRYETALEQINTALRANAISQQEATRMMMQAERAYLSMDTASTRMSRSVGAGAGSMRQLGLQLNQVAQVGGMTGDWMGSIAMQLPDILLAFGTLGVYAGVAAGALIPLISNLDLFSSSSERAKEAVSNLEEAVGALIEANDAVGISTQELTKKYGAMATVMATALELERVAAYRDAALAANSALASMTDTAERLGEALAMADASSTTLDEFSGVQGRAEAVASAVQEISDKFNISTEAAEELGRAMLTASNSTGTFAEKAVLIENVRDLLIEATREAGTYNEAAQLAGDLLNDAVIAAVDLSIVDMSSGIGDAADEAARLAANLKLVSSGRGQDPRLFDPENRLSDRFQPDDDLYQDYVKSQRTTNRRRGGSRGQTQEQRELNDAMREYQSILRRTQTEAERYADAQAAIVLLHEQGEITLDEKKDALERLNKVYSETPGLVSDLQSATEAGFSSMLVDIKNAENALLSFGNALYKIAADYAASSIGDALFPSGGGGFGGWLSGVGDGFSNWLGGLFGGGKATGGPVQAGMAYLVNENTPNSELFVPSQSGAVLNVSQAQAALSAKPPVINLHVHQQAGSPPPQVNQDGDRVDLVLSPVVASTMTSPPVRSVLESVYGIRPVITGA